MASSGASSGTVKTYGHDSGIAVYVFRDRRFLYVDRLMGHLTGFSRKKLLQIDPGVLTHPEDEPDLLRREEARADGEPVPFSYTMRIIRKDGEEAILLISTEPILYDGAPASLGRCRDITYLDFEDEIECMSAGERMRNSGLLENYRVLASKLCGDMRNLLSALSIQLDEALDHVPDSSPASGNLRLSLGLIADGGGMCDLIDAGMETASTSDRQLVDLSRLVLDMYSFLSRLAPGRTGIEVVTESLLPVLGASADMLRLLVMNAALVTLGSQSVPLRVRTSGSGADRVVLSVSPVPGWLGDDLISRVRESGAGRSSGQGVSAGLDGLVDIAQRLNAVLSVSRGADKPSGELVIELPAVRSGV
jgi:PAS domain S-box-containing protein